MDVQYLFLQYMFQNQETEAFPAAGCEEQWLWGVDGPFWIER